MLHNPEIVDVPYNPFSIIDIGELDDDYDWDELEDEPFDDYEYEEDEVEYAS